MAGRTGIHVARLAGALAALLAFAGALGAADIDLRFLFDGFPAEIRGKAGEKREIQGFAALETTRTDIDASWTQVMTADGGKIIDVSIEGLLLLTFQGQSRPIDRNLFSSLGPTRGGDGEVVHKDDPTRFGAFSSVVAVGYPRSAVNPAPGVVHRVAFLTVEVTIPPAGRSQDLVLRYEDGFYPPGGLPLPNMGASRGKSLVPTETVPITVVLRGLGGRFFRGDADADGAPSIADAVFVLEYLFDGEAAPPCEQSADANDDGKVNITDAVYTLRFLFLGGPWPPAPYWDMCELDPTADALSCVSFPPCD